MFAKKRKIISQQASVEGGNKVTVAWAFLTLCALSSGVVNTEIICVVQNLHDHPVSLINPSKESMTPVSNHSSMYLMLVE